MRGWGILWIIETARRKWCGGYRFEREYLRMVNFKYLFYSFIFKYYSSYLVSIILIIESRYKRVDMAGFSSNSLCKEVAGGITWKKSFVSALWKFKCPRKVNIMVWLAFMEGFNLAKTLRDKGKVLWQTYFFAIMWDLWIERNGRIFKRVERSWEEVCGRLLGLISLCGPKLLNCFVIISWDLFFWIEVRLLVKTSFEELVFCMPLYFLHLLDEMLVTKKIFG